MKQILLMALSLVCIVHPAHAGKDTNKKVKKLKQKLKKQKKKAKRKKKKSDKRTEALLQLIENGTTEQILYAPWRQDYNTRVSHKKSSPPLHDPFCQIAHGNEEGNVLLYRSELIMVMLNNNPYGPGHLLITPTSHVTYPDELSEQTRFELMVVQDAVLKIVRTVFNPDGLNIAVNAGSRCTGASIPHHLHYHILPRNNGDSPGIHALSNTVVISSPINTKIKELKKEFEKINIKAAKEKFLKQLK